MQERLRRIESKPTLINPCKSREDFGPEMESPGESRKFFFFFLFFFVMCNPTLQSLFSVPFLSLCPPKGKGGKKATQTPETFLHAFLFRLKGITAPSCVRGGGEGKGTGRKEGREGNGRTTEMRKHLKVREGRRE